MPAIPIASDPWSDQHHPIPSVDSGLTSPEWATAWRWESLASPRHNRRYRLEAASVGAAVASSSVLAKPAEFGFQLADAGFGGVRAGGLGASFPPGIGQSQLIH